ncbi:MAG: DEAD/DEAH box helicase [Armatimonadota bacterium]
MDFSEFLNDIQQSPTYADQLIHIRETEARQAQYANPTHLLSAPIQAMLKSKGIDRLYTHQAQAIDAIRDGKNALVVTGTASGKSLCYTIPLIEKLLEDPQATALLLFPTKALCQDQFHGINAALTAAGLRDVLAGVFDADTPAPTRRKLRDHGSLILTNPDMVHAGMMPQHARWAAFLSRLKCIVLDELHVYNGIFGSNMGNLLRRFFRLCRHYGSEPQLVACSATIGNPRELAEGLTGREFTLIDGDGSPRGKRTYVFWNPPRIRERDWRSRRSANVEAHELMAMLVQRGVRTITFSKTKMTAEMIHRYVSERLQGVAPHLMKKLSPYRGGYLPAERREIERKLFNGELLGVSTTRALELGIDVGGLDAGILVGYPGTLASFFQQSGRAGRSTDDALIVLVGLDTPANQYVMHHPEYLFGRPVEQAVIDPDNPFVITNHLRSATHELGLPDAEVPLFGPHAPMVLRILQENMKVQHIDERWYHAATETPQFEFTLRSYSDANVIIQDADTGAVLGEVDKFDAEPILHPEAIYMHQGDTYRVLSLDMVRNLALVKREEVDYYTQPIGGTDVNHVDHCLREKPFGTGMAYWGEVTAYFNTAMFEKIRFYELDAISRHGVDLPKLTLETTALWLVPPEALMAQVRLAGLDAFNGLRGVGYATRMILPLFITCDTLDFSHSVGCVNAPWNTLFIYERYPHGLGFTEKAYHQLHDIMPAVLTMIRQCPCEDGCPCCVGKPLRGELVWNPERGEGSIPSKASALMVLEGLLGDGANLQAPEIQALTDTDTADQIRLEQALRRRLEVMREPQIPHPIEPKVETRYPEVEKTEALPRADVEQRIDRRRNFHRELRKRIAEHIETDQLPPNAPPPGMKTRHGVNPPTAFSNEQTLGEKPEIVQPREMGDSLAARARRLKKQKEHE